jgi:hypothetical protein
MIWLTKVVKSFMVGFSLNKLTEFG